MSAYEPIPESRTRSEWLERIIEGVPHVVVGVIAHQEVIQRMKYCAICDAVLHTHLTETTPIQVCNNCGTKYLDSMEGLFMAGSFKTDQACDHCGGTYEKRHTMNVEQQNMGITYQHEWMLVYVCPECGNQKFDDETRQLLKEWFGSIKGLVAQRKPQKLTSGEWLQRTSEEYKWELIDGMAFGSDIERDRLILALIYNIGLERLVQLLPKESIQILRELLT